MADMIATGVKLAREASVKLKEEEGQRARADLSAAIEARDVNMARLKALRLERDRLEAVPTIKRSNPARRRSPKERPVP